MIGEKWLFFLSIVSVALLFRYYRGAYFRKIPKIRVFISLVLFTVGLSFILMGRRSLIWEPSVSVGTEEPLEIVIVLDISNSMLATDIAPNRLDRGKSIALSLIGELPNAEYGLIIFKGEAHIAVPLTSEVKTLQQFLFQVTPAALSAKGSNFEGALKKVLDIQKTSLSRKRIVLLLTDGESDRGNPKSELLRLKREGIPLYIPLLGTDEGTTITIKERVIRDSQGVAVVTKLNREALESAAKITNGAVLEAKESSLLLQVIEEKIKATPFLPTLFERLLIALGVILVILSPLNNFNRRGAQSTL